MNFENVRFINWFDECCSYWTEKQQKNHDYNYYNPKHVIVYALVGSKVLDILFDQDEPDTYCRLIDDSFMCINNKKTFENPS